MNRPGDAADRRARFLAALRRKRVGACFLLATTFRSGSTFLGEMLFHETKLAFHRERFNMVPTWYKLSGRRLDEELDQALSPVVKGSYASKLMWPHRNNLATFLGIDRARSRELLDVFPNARFVHLSRRDKVAQAVSYYIARKTDNWTGGDEGEAVDAAVEYSFHPIFEYYTSLAYHDSLWEDFFRALDVEVTTVFFEDAIAEPPAAVARVLDAFGLPPASSGSSPALQTTRRRGELSAAFREHFLDDLYAMSPPELLPGRLIGPFTPR